MLGIFLDTETTGLDIHIHRIIEIGIKFIDLQTGHIIDEYQSVIFQPIEIWEKSDIKSLEINGFTWDEIKNGKKENEVAEEIIHNFVKHQVVRKKAVFICQNPSFDRAFLSQIISPKIQESLNWPYHWLDLASMFWAISLKDLQNNASLYPWEIGLSKDRIAVHYNIEKEKKPHKAMNGVNHLLRCYEKVVGFPFSQK